VPDDAVELVGDDARLVQLLQNLLSNAAKYTDSGGDIRLQVRVEDGDVVSVVSDNGCGIAPEALERIFDLFAQEEGAGAAAESGLGIGLTLCRNVAEMHGGVLVAESAGIGRGSRFTLRLPITPLPAAAGEEAGVAAIPRMLLDLNMPEVNGYAVLRRLRELPMQRRPYVAAMTGYGHVGDRARTLAAGFDAHLIKPVDVEQLREMLAHAGQGGA